jgi:anaerobic ribonucleoside-triphosphate reductase activating protein
MAEIDVLIDRPYIDSLNDSKGLRGSTNQRIHFLSGIYKEFVVDFIESKRGMELHLFSDEYLLVGLKPQKGQGLSL